MNKLNIDAIPEFYLQRVFDKTLAGLRLFVRDVDLTEEQAAQYAVGDIIFERGYTEATGLIGGIPTSHRFAILSNHMTDISTMSSSDEVRSWGLFVARPGSRFKVLDISECRGKTQILLLHLPDDENWRLFSGVSYEIESEYVKRSLEDFTSNCKPQVIEAVATQRWLDRCKAPLGFVSEGNPFTVETPVEGRIKSVEDAGFRTIANSVILLKSLRISLAAQDEASPKEWPDYLAYGFIDENAGLCARLLSSARIVEGAVEVLHDFDGATKSIYLGDYKNLGIAQIVDDSLVTFAEEISEVEQAHPASFELEQLRMMEEIDHARDLYHPDIVTVRLMTKKRMLHDEQGTMKLIGIQDGAIRATLLVEPEQNMGIHEGEMLPVTLTRVKDGIAPVVLVEDALAARD